MNNLSKLLATAAMVSLTGASFAQTIPGINAKVAGHEVTEIINASGHNVHFNDLKVTIRYQNGFDPIGYWFAKPYQKLHIHSDIPVTQLGNRYVFHIKANANSGGFEWEAGESHALYLVSQPGKSGQETPDKVAYIRAFIEN